MILDEYVFRMSVPRCLVLVSVVVLCAAVVTGCGGDDAQKPAESEAIQTVSDGELVFAMNTPDARSLFKYCWGAPGATPAVLPEELDPEQVDVIDNSVEALIDSETLNASPLVRGTYWS